MTSVGRGRGWGSVQNKEPVLRRPGGATENTEYDNVINLIQSMSIDDQISSQKIQDIGGFIFCTSQEETKKRVSMIYQQCKEDRLFGLKFAKIFCSPDYQKIEKENETSGSRKAILNNMQSDYLIKEELREKSITEFQNSIFVLSEIYYRYKFSSGLGLRVLAWPLLDYANMLLEDPTTDNIILLTTVIILNGIKLTEMNQEFLTNLRQVLVSQDLCPSSRAMLLLVLELSSQNFRGLFVDVKEFYVSQFEPKDSIYVQYLCSVLDNLVIECTENMRKRRPRPTPKKAVQPKAAN